MKYVIQAFALMSDQSREQHHRFPFYLLYRQKARNGIVIFPPFSIAVLRGQNNWSFYNASHSSERRYNLNEYLNYENAEKRFLGRLSQAEVVAADTTGINIGCYSVASFMLLYLILHILASNGFLGPLSLPLNPNAIVPYFCSMAVFVILPSLLPFISSITLGCISVKMDINKEL